MTTTLDVEQIDEANSTGKPPVVFVHGLWLLPTSWERWEGLFSEAGFAPVAPGWPDDPEPEAREHPEVMANRSIGDVADHFAELLGRLERKPAVVGHSFGGLITEIVAGRGMAEASVAISPAPCRGVPPLPISALRSASPPLQSPGNGHGAVPLTFDQFRYAFANAVDEDEARQLYVTYTVPAPGEPLFQSAATNLNPWTEAEVDSENPKRGPLLIIGGEKDHTVPPSILRASYDREKRNRGETEIVMMPDRGHALTIDHGWREVAQTTLDFIRRFM